MSANQHHKFSEVSLFSMGMGDFLLRYCSAVLSGSFRVDFNSFNARRYALQICLGLGGFEFVLRSLHHEKICHAWLAKGRAFCFRERGFVMRIRHWNTRSKSVMLELACQTIWLMQKLHDRSRILPDPDILHLIVGPPPGLLLRPSRRT